MARHPTKPTRINHSGNSPKIAIFAHKKFILMKRIQPIFLFSVLLLASTLVNAQSGKAEKFTAEEDSLFINTLLELPGVVNVESIPSNMHFRGKYKIMLAQPLDHNNPEKGHFHQRMYLLHKDFEKPMVVTTEGYAGDYGAYPFYENELDGIVDGNEILIEHRYFSQSTPEQINWDYLTVENAAADHHKIIETFKNLYHDKWISTGISKGGQTALYHNYYYPDDADLCIPYVAPMNYAVEDGRHEPFIEKNGSKKEQKAVKNFQIEVLKRRGNIMPMFLSHIEEKGYTFRIPIEEVYDFCVLEYSFAFWQWVADTDIIPGPEASDEDIFQHLISVSGPEYFSVEGATNILPFFIQAAKELGYYGYSTKPFEELLIIDDAENYLYEVFLPDSLHNLAFNGVTNATIIEYLNNNDPDIILIYGEHDPWSSSGIFFKKKKNMKKFIKKDGHHATRIGNMPEKQKEKVIGLIESYMGH